MATDLPLGEAGFAPVSCSPQSEQIRVSSIQQPNRTDLGHGHVLGQVMVNAVDLRPEACHRFAKKHPRMPRPCDACTPKTSKNNPGISSESHAMLVSA